MGAKLAALRASPKTASAKAKFIMATDGVMLEAEDLNSGETIACKYRDFSDHFGFFLPLAGISTVREIKNNPVHIKATGRLNKLYIELLNTNAEWGADARRHDLNQFMARLIFCFFAEDTGIFESQLFTKTVEQMSDGQSGKTHEVIADLFRAMDTRLDDRKAAGIRNWAERFPYVNGSLFSGGTECPIFSRIARSYLLRAGELDWQAINPDIFGSMIQAVADEGERGDLGMHYTSVPNILKVLDPLFLDDLREHLEQAGDSVRKLRNLRKRLSTIRVFDPACGSGNFLVIAYKEMRLIEHEIVKRNDDEPKSWISLTNFYGIEIRDFAAEIARLSLLIAEFQSDVRLISQKEARLGVLPLKRTGQIHTGNALRMDWLEVCPPAVQMDQKPTDLFKTEPTQAAIDFGAKQVETYICGNPPYLGRKYQTKGHKDELRLVFAGRTKDTLALDYVSGWFIKANDYLVATNAENAFVSTNSICQGVQVPILWPVIFGSGTRIRFAYTSFKWSNLAGKNAGVTVAVLGLTRDMRCVRLLFTTGLGGEVSSRRVDNINGYLVAAVNVEVTQRKRVLDSRTPMHFGNHPYYANDLILAAGEARLLRERHPEAAAFLRPLHGSQEFITGRPRACLWISDAEVSRASDVAEISRRFDAVARARAAVEKDSQAQRLRKAPHRFRDRLTARERLIIPYLPAGLLAHVPIVSSENRQECVIHSKAFALYDAPLWNFSFIVSRLHLVWIGTVCVRLRTDFSYSNTLGWNTFPAPPLTEKNKTDLSRCAEDILLAREGHFPATIAELYDADAMPDDLRRAHEKNDETLERVYIGRRFRNDTERLEKLFELYTKMMGVQSDAKGAA